MTALSNPRAGAELLAAFEKNQREVADFFSSFPVETFFAQPPGKWSPAENLLHLIKSVSAVTKAMKLPKWCLQLLFGRRARAPRSYQQIKEFYQQTLAAGAQAPERFIPLIEAAAHSEPGKQALLEKWRAKIDALLQVMPHWREEQLDQYRLPHPLLGKLTVREMLFFTLYHNEHHVNNVQKLLRQ